MSEIIGKRVDEVYNFTPEVAAVREERYENALFSKKIEQYEDEINGKYYVNSFHPILDEQKNVTRILVTICDITGQKELHDKLELKRLMFNHTKDAIYLVDHETLQILDGNENSYKSLGYTRKELLQLCVSDIDTRITSKEKAAEIKTTSEKYPFIRLESEYQRKDGTIFPVEINSKYVVYNEKSYQILSVWDITEKYQNCQTLEESQADYKDLVDNVKSIIFRMDTNGDIYFFNKYAQLFFGYTEKEILGKNILGTILPETSLSGHDLSDLIIDIGTHPEKYANNENENMREKWRAGSGIMDQCAYI